MQLDIHKLVQLVEHEELCRICLHHIDGVPHKLDEDFGGEPLYKTYSIVTNIKFPPEEKYGPDCICNGCLKRLSSCHNFITTCCNSNFVYWIAKNHSKIEEWKNFASKDVYEISKELGLTSENNGGDVPLPALQVHTDIPENEAEEKSTPEEATIDEVRVKTEKVDQVQSNRLEENTFTKDVESNVMGEESSTSLIKVERNDEKTIGMECSQTTAPINEHSIPPELEGAEKSTELSSQTTQSTLLQGSCIILQENVQEQKGNVEDHLSVKVEPADAHTNRTIRSEQQSRQPLTPLRNDQKIVEQSEKQSSQPITPLRNDENQKKVEQSENKNSQPSTPLRRDVIQKEAERSEKPSSQPTTPLRNDEAEQPNAKRMKLDECSCCRTYKKRYKDLQRSPVRIECRSCNGFFFSIVALKRHLYVKHREGESFKCIICEKEFIQWYCFERHLEVTHPHVEKCTHCRKVFECSSDLKDHLVKIHKNPQILIPVH